MDFLEQEQFIGADCHHPLKSKKGDKK